MKITIKNVKHSEFASQETHCFQATVYVDGKRAFGVENDGHGGSNNYYTLNDKMTGSDMWKWISKIDTVLEDEKIEGDGYSILNCLEIEIGERVNEWLNLREAKKTVRRIAYVKPDGNVYVLPAKVKPTAKNLTKVQKISCSTSYRSSKWLNTSDE